jgi:vesicle coat complex subunit
MATMSKVIIDKSAYVRKIACLGLYKIVQGSQHFNESCSDIIDLDQVNISIL